ncbi:GNAT family N-acetyltransferase [Clostridium sp. B9]|uniref:GNAT family N-acetyltransferase n=1 Tax=Clostridium sp. B9 TaxID=3423224 RepID=UPI003D2EF18D
MRFRKSNISDLNDLVDLIEQAKKFLRENGVDQWQDGYPYESDLRNDIEEDISYVIDNGNKIIGISSISFDGEKTYENIYEGNWITDDRYAVMHRVAVHNEFKGKGVFSKLLREAEKLAAENGVFSIKIDTHVDNIVMQNSLIKNGFERCGIIYLDDGNKRIAFEKVINNYK